MKVICAGMIKTGTKSMTEALRILGFSVYDYMENLEYLGDDWLKLLEKGGGSEDFRRMYENVDAVADVPPAHFWDEIHKAFPESKIILTMRDTEEEWIKSVDKQMKAVGIPILFFIRFFSPTGRKMMYYSSLVANAVFGHDSKFSFFKPPSFNNFLMKMAYRRHNLHVIQ
uniref:Sulfotransferase n=1 Tax=Ciona savignyi TaxID=51511 RepID=H2ZG75_CIOSA